MKRLITKLTRLLAPEYEQKRAPSKIVAVVVPVSSRPNLTLEEEISLRHLKKYLGHYDKYVIAPKGLNFAFDTFSIINLDAKFFGGMRAHNQMLYSPSFFKLFEDYKYILLYHLDALVFSDDLLKWCETNVDYIGAPWIPCADSPWVKEPRVGNGGFALYKIESTIKALQNRYRIKPGQYWEEKLLPVYDWLHPLLGKFGAFSKSTGEASPGVIRQQLIRFEKARQHLPNSDLFFSIDAEKYCPNYKVADWKTGLRFAFEVAPRMCLEMNQGRMPFGCHAWARYDRSFWEPHLLQ